MAARGWSLQQRTDKSVERKEYYQKHPEAAKEHSGKLKEYYRKHPEAVKELGEKRKRFWENLEARNKQSERTKVAMTCPEVSEKSSIAHKRYYKEHPEARRIKSEKLKEQHRNPEARERLYKGQREVRNRPEFKALISKRLKEILGTQENKKRTGERSKKYWATCSVEERKARALHMRMGHTNTNTKYFCSKGEKALCKTIQQHYPMTQGSRWIAGYQADIVLYEFKINIEYDGVYWHQNPEKDRKRDEFLLKLGWTVLRVREGEAFDIDVLHKLIEEKWLALPEQKQLISV